MSQVPKTVHLRSPWKKIRGATMFTGQKSAAASAADTLWSLVSLGWLRVCGLTNFECEHCLGNSNALAVTIAFVQPTRSVQERLA
jgi:hypothetical protein